MKVWKLALLVSLFLNLCIRSEVLAFPVEVAEAPSTNLNLTVKSIQSAKKSLLVNIYEMTSAEIGDALAAQIRNGIRVEILEEGDPVGGFSDSARTIQERLVKEMKKVLPKQRASSKDRYLIMSRKAGGERRFRFNHAKYIVVDGSYLLIGSENYSPGGNPLPNASGNRGWEVWVDESKLAREFTALFKKDSDVSQGDLLNVLEDEFQVLGSPGEVAVASDGRAPITVSGSSDGGLGNLNATDVRSVLSPDSSREGLIELISGASSNIDLELMTFHMNWGRSGENSPLFNAVVSAARRGVKVRVLLNDERAFFRTAAWTISGELKNQITVQELNKIAGEEGLPIVARTANLKSMGVNYIHNKGALFDSDQTLISSINWNENSVENNREAAIVLTSFEVCSHYRALFDQDWKKSSSQWHQVLNPFMQGGFRPFREILLPLLVE